MTEPGAGGAELAPAPPLLPQSQWPWLLGGLVSFLVGVPPKAEDEVKKEIASSIRGLLVQRGILPCSITKDVAHLPLVGIAGVTEQETHGSEKTLKMGAVR